MNRENVDHLMYLLVLLANQSIIDTHEDPRKRPKNPPTVDTSPAPSMTRYSCLVFINKSSYLNPRRNIAFDLSILYEEEKNLYYA